MPLAAPLIAAAASMAVAVAMDSAFACAIDAADVGDFSGCGDAARSARAPSLAGAGAVLVAESAAKRLPGIGPALTGASMLRRVLARTGVGAISGAAGGLGVALVTGEDPGEAMLHGAIGGAIAENVFAVGRRAFGAKETAAALARREAVTLARQETTALARRGPATFSGVNVAARAVIDLDEVAPGRWEATPGVRHAPKALPPGKSMLALPPAGEWAVGVAGRSAVADHVSSGFRAQIRVASAEFTPAQLDQMRAAVGGTNARIGSGALARTGDTVPYSSRASRRFVRDQLFPGRAIDDIRIADASARFGYSVQVDEVIPRFLGGRQVPQNQRFLPQWLNERLGPLEYSAVKDLASGTRILGFNLIVDGD